MSASPTNDRAVGSYPMNSETPGFRPSPEPQPSDDVVVGSRPIPEGEVEGMFTDHGYALKRVALEDLWANPNFHDIDWMLQTWTPGYRGFKRGLDLVLSGTMLFLTIPLFGIVAALIRTDSKGPVFYSQWRLGRHGKRFRIYKFRSMRQDAEEYGAVYADKDDPRVTRVGRFLRSTRIDELPQLWNVIRGDMSLIGPRPERPENEQMLEDGIPGFGLRTCVKPGLTGWAQICAPYANTIAQSGRKLEYDLYYIRHASVWLDLEIAWRTVRVMLGFAGQ